jgi:hypothetical protein
MRGKNSPSGLRNTAWRSRFCDDKKARHAALFLLLHEAVQPISPPELLKAGAIESPFDLPVVTPSVDFVTRKIAVAVPIDRTEIAMHVAVAARFVKTQVAVVIHICQ